MIPARIDAGTRCFFPSRIVLLNSHTGKEAHPDSCRNNVYQQGDAQAAHGQNQTGGGRGRKLHKGLHSRLNAV